jgi:PPE-repeat protein
LLRPPARLMRVLALASLILTAPVNAADSGTSPWSFVNGAANGYAVQLVSAVPAPGTQIFPGQTLEFRVTVGYQLSMAETGSVILVIQDENDQNLGTGPQKSQTVERGQGNVTLAQSFVVPADAREIHLIIPLVPQGVEHTSGELIRADDDRCQHANGCSLRSIQECMRSIDVGIPGPEPARPGLARATLNQARDLLRTPRTRGRKAWVLLRRPPAIDGNGSARDIVGARVTQE